MSTGQLKIDLPCGHSSWLDKKCIDCTVKARHEVKTGCTKIMLLLVNAMRQQPLHQLRLWLLHKLDAKHSSVRPRLVGVKAECQNYAGTLWSIWKTKLYITKYYYSIYLAWLTRLGRLTLIPQFHTCMMHNTGSLAACISIHMSVCQLTHASQPIYYVSVAWKRNAYTSVESFNGLPFSLLCIGMLQGHECKKSGLS